MGLTDDYNMENEYGNMQDADSYGQDAALDLISRLCSRFRKSGQGPDIPRLREYINNRLPDILGSPSLHDESLSREFEGLERFNASFLENCRLPMLRGKIVLGIGGAFSAGKSRFLNSLTGMDNLPEDQGPATAIGTYLLKADKFAIYAHTKSNGLETLEAGELKAISHNFYNTYKIGFADILHKLIITSPKFRDNLILLDTPGYNKDSRNTEMEAIDRRIALEHLKSSDYLIWLIDITQGTITGNDINFLTELEMKNPCLVVFNKAAERSERERKDTVRETRKILENQPIPLFGVTAYSSSDGMELDGGDLVARYLDLAAAAKPFSENDELARLKKTWEDSFERQKKNLKTGLDTISRSIISSTDVTHIRGLLASYASLYSEKTALYHAEQKFSENLDKFSDDLARYA